MGDWEVVPQATSNASSGNKSAPSNSSSDWEVVPQQSPQPSTQAPYLGGSQDTSNEQAAALSLGQAYNVGSIRTPEYKAKYVQELFPGSQVSVQPDKRIMITSPQGTTSFIEPHREGGLNWIKDNVTKLAEFAGDQALPLVGQIGADIAAVGAAPETGGASMLGLAGANAAGAAAGRGLQQAYNNNLIGEPYSAGDVALQGAAGAASVPIAAALAPVAKGTVKALGNMIGNVARPLADAFPSVAESLMNIGHMNGEWLVEQMKAGRAAGDIINDVNADSNRSGKIVRNLLFGNPLAKGTTDELIPQYQRLIKPVSSDPGKVGVLDNFFSRTLGLNQDTLDIMKKTSANELLSRTNTDPQAWRTLADYSVNSIEQAQKNLSTQYGKVKQAFIDSTKDKTLPVSDQVNQFIKDAQDLRILDGKDINPNYTGNAAKKAYEDILSKLQVLTSSDASSAAFSRNEGSRALRITPEQLSMLQNKSSPLDLSKMKVSDILKFKAEVQPMLERTFEGTGLSQAEKRPLAQFLSKLDESIYSLKGSAPMKAMNEKYGNFQSAKSLFKTLQEGDLTEQQGVISQLKQSLAKESSTRETAQSYITDLDNQLKNKILPKLQVLGASQDLRAAKLNDSAVSLVGQLKTIHQSGISPDKQREAADLLKTVDNAIQQKSFKFYSDMRDHLTAEAFSSNKQNFMRTRSLMGITAGALGATSMLHVPVVGTAATVYGLTHLTPAGIGKAIVRGDAARLTMQGLSGRVGQSVSQSATNPYSKALLASLIRKKTGL